MNLNPMAMIDWPKSKINNDQWQQLNRLLANLEPEQKLWLSGYLAASAENSKQATHNHDEAEVAQQLPKDKLTILYGSQTGNSESVAKQLKTMAEDAGVLTEIFSLADFSVKQLLKQQLVTLIISTHGEGEAPDDAEEFYEKLFSSKAPQLNNLQYSVLALGDSSYELFCHTGKEIDQRLNDLGAKKLYQRIDCDVDFELDADRWIKAVLPKIEQQLKSQSSESDNITTLPIKHNLPPTLASRANPFAAEILTIQKITGRGSTKNTFHIELATDPSAIQYQPGDSLGVLAKNNSDAVKGLIKYWQLKGDETFEFKQLTASIDHLLSEQVEITQISKPLIKYLSQQINDETLFHLATSHEAFNAYCENHQLLDLLAEFDPSQSIETQQILDQLRAITPRLYSIASAQSAYEDEVHLTVNLEPATVSGHFGLASGLLCNTAKVGDVIDIFVEHNKNFKLPEDGDTPVILIGPGTGVAPFRAFLQERKSQQSKGENWLIFGNPHFTTDFLYQAEWIKLQQQGLLNDIDLAFSRDQNHKIYVQDKLKAKSQQIWEWLEKGASIYLCGDANHMAKSVEQALLEIISEQGHLSLDDAKSHLKQLKRSHQFQKDIY